MNKEQMLGEMEILFLGLGDKTRLRILNLMREDEVNVNLFAEILEESQPKISRHLAYLKASGLVETRRAGKLIYYRISESEENFQSFFIEHLLNWLENQKFMNDEYRKIKEFYRSKNNSQNEIVETKQDIYADTHTNSRKELEIFLL